jgi:hypothetical protein
MPRSSCARLDSRCADRRCGARPWTAASPVFTFSCASGANETRTCLKSLPSGARTITLTFEQTSGFKHEGPILPADRAKARLHSLKQRARKQTLRGQ